MDPYKELTAKGKAAYQQALEEIGWWNYPGNNRQKFEENYDRYDEPIFSVGALAHYVDDAEIFEDNTDEQYLALWDECLGKYLPGWKFGAFGDAMTVKLTIQSPNGTETFETEQGSWFEDEFLDKINNLLELEGSPNRFYVLPPEDQCFSFVFIPETLFEAALAKGVIPADLEFFLNEEDFGDEED